MPTTLPSSFASAAAGNSADGSGRASSRGESGGFGEWSRRPNGATQTFRRSSTTPTHSATSSYQRDVPVPTSTNQPQSAGAYVPPHVGSSRNGSGTDTRYSKLELLELFKLQKQAGDLDEFPADLYVGDTDLSLSNGTASHRWLRRDEQGSEAPSGPEVCWDREGSVEPMGLFEMTEEERELFTTSVNSPLKGLNQSGAREGSAKEGGTIGRKSSISQGQSSNFNVTTPTASRPVGRRREPSESFSTNKDSPGPSSAGKSETAQSSSLFRRRTEMRESGSGSLEDRDKESFNLGSNPSFGSLKRSTTNPLSAGVNAPSSPWSAQPQSEAMSPMGTFGNFALGGRSGSISTEKRPGLGGARGESRFRGLMNKPSADEDMGAVKEKDSTSSLNRVDESGSSRTGSRGFDAPSDRQFGQQDMSIGGAIFGRESQGESPAPQQSSAEYGFSSAERFGEFGASSHTIGRGSFAERQSQEQGHSQAYRSYGAFPAEEEPMSPTFTNPYRSPEQTNSNLRDLESEEMDETAFHLPGLGGFQEDSAFEFSQNAFSNQQRGIRIPTQESRSQFDQPGSGSAVRPFPSLGGLGGALPGLGSPGPWSPHVATGTPGRERSAFNEGFGEAALRSPGALQSPNVTGFGSAGSGTVGKGSRLGSLFPGAMQEQMRSTDQSRALKSEEVIFGTSEDDPSQYGTPPSQGIMGGSSGFRREGESPFHTGRGKFDDFFGSAEKQKGDSSVQSSSQPYSPAQAPSAIQPPSHQGMYPSQPQPQQSGQHTVQRVSSFSSGQPPAAQQKTMVMPDRIRWIYRDPQGNTQGPWSGLEMHDWYRAGFFSPELLVKKVEDPDYEPLAQLIRRIGNSREPFLVPQIGIPGPPTSQGGVSQWPGQTQPPPSSTPQSAQPPFAGSFPSFGTTLTADQQNALERRKQEEQYLMARQKEHLAQQQMLMKQLQMQGQGSGMHSQLQHHSSAQSLHSQPSFGSVTSPGGFQQQTSSVQGPGNQQLSGSFENALKSGGPGGAGAEFSNMNLGRESQSAFGGGQGPVGRPQFQDYMSQDERTAAMLNDRQRLQQEQAKADYLQQEAQDGGANLDRFKEFQELRQDLEDREYSETENLHWKHSAAMGEELDQSGMILDDRGLLNEDAQTVDSMAMFRNSMGIESGESEAQGLSLSLTEQVQKAASAKKTPTDAVASPWAKIDSPSADQIPPLSTSPLPAPAARRSRQNVADALVAESGSQSASPSVDAATSSVAPWARDVSESQKQPSLKEIQEAEARRAAKQEEIVAAARRAALEKDMAHQPPPAPGLPSTSTWGSSESPINSASGSSPAWTKPAVGKPTTTTQSGAKKTLSQIQKEQEALARKQKTAVPIAAASNGSTAAAAATVASTTAQASSSGKRYADLAGKAASPVPPAAAGAWTTVGAGGKPKVPTISTGPPAATRAVSSGSVPTASASATRPKPTTSTSSTSLVNAQVVAHEEFKKWAVAELRPDLSKGVNADEFVGGLLSLPSDTDMITEAVHQVSQTLDSRHFAEEFVRRRALADKGKSEPSPTAAGTVSAGAQGTESKSAGGWNEVARKGPASASAAKDESSAFKIVAKKKGAKR